MSLVYLPLIGLASVYLLWVFYLAVMSLKRAKQAGLLGKTATFFGTPMLVVGYLLDAFANIFVMTLVLLEMPEELTVTARLKRHIKTSKDWRLGIALWFVPLLDPFDPSGRHIT
jgi:predicted transporter